jgi:hypothetical protein
MKLKLKKEDLRWSHWRNIAADPRPKAKAFSLADCLQSLQALPLMKAYPYKPNWSKLKLNISMSREEAHFWLEAIYKASENRVVYKQELMDYMQRPEANYDGNLGLDKVSVTVKPYLNAENFIPTMHIIPAFVLLNSQDFVQFLDERLKIYYRGDNIEEAFRLHILPYLSPEEKEALREAIRPYLERSINSPKLPHRQDFFGFAGLLGGMDSELEYYLKIYPTKSLPLIVGYYNYALYAAFGLSTRDKVENAIRSNELVVYKHFIRAWLAHTELDGLDWLAYSIPNLRYSAAQNQVFKTLKGIAEPETVLPMLELCENKKFGADALRWLDANPDRSSKVLVPLALTGHPQATQIEKYLRHMLEQQQISWLEPEVLKLDAEAQVRFRSEILRA